MPTGNPIVGETWTTQDATGRIVRGVVAEVLPNVITLVSLTGNRLRASPDRFNWQFESSAPVTTVFCQTRECISPAAMMFDRGRGREFTCPRHMLQGVHGALINQHTPEPFPTEQRVLPDCLLCEGSTLVEELGVQGAMMVRCGGCNARMAILADAESMSAALIVSWAGQHLYPQEAVVGYETRIGIEFLSIRRVSGSGSEPRLYDIRVQISSRITGQEVWILFNRTIRDLQLRDSPQPQPVTPVAPPEELIVSPAPGSKWHNRLSGTVATIEQVISDVVLFRESGASSNAAMSVTDFRQYHRRLEDIKSTVPAEPLPNVRPGEEWEYAGSTYKVIERNDQLKTAIIETSSGQRRSIRLVEMYNWRPFTRVNAFERLLQGSDFED